MSSKEPIKWKAISMLITLIIIIVCDIYWAWGIIFIIWTIPDILTGDTYLMEPINKTKNPILFWSIIITWLFTGFYIIGDKFIF